MPAQLRLPRRLRTRLLLLVMVPMLPCAALFVYDAVQFRRSSVHGAVLDAQRMVHLGALFHEHRIGSTERLLRGLAGHTNLESTKSAACRELLNGTAAEHREVADLRYVLPNGGLVCSARSTSDVAMGNEQHLGLVTAVVTKGKFAYTSYVMDSALGRPVATLGYPITGKSGHVVGVLIAAIDLAWVSEFARSAMLSPGVTMAAIGRDGRLMARLPDHARWAGMSVAETPLHADVLRQRGEGTTSGVAVDGITRMYAFTALAGDADGSLQYMTVGIPVEGVYSASTQTLATSLGLLLIVCGLTTAAAWAFANAAVVDPVRRVLEATHRITGGDLSARTGVVRRGGEIESLALSFDAMAESLEARSRETDAAARALADSEERFRLLAESMKDLVCLHSLDGHIEYVSPSCQWLLGYRPSELIGRDLLELVHPDDVESVATNGFRAALAGRTSRAVTYRARMRDGQYTWLESLAQPVRDAVGNPLRMQTTSRDVTERHQAEEHLRNERDYVSHIISVTPVLVCGIAPDGTTTFANPAVEATTGYRAEDLIGRNWWTTFHPGEQYAQVTRLNEALERGPVREYEMDLTTADGRVRTVSWNSLNKLDASGRITEVIGFGTDITDRKRAEREREQLEVQLRHAQKLEAIGNLAAGIAHEINTPTQYIGDNIRFLGESFSAFEPVIHVLDELTATDASRTELALILERGRQIIANADLPFLRDEVPKAIAQSLDGVDHVARIVRAMKEFSHPGSEEKARIDLNRAIESTVTVATNEWKYVASLRTDFDHGLPEVGVRVSEFNQVILNLIVNAAQAIGEAIEAGRPGQGKITITTRRVGGWAEIRIADTGIGIPPQIRSRVFDPFFTTKSVGRGSGQGLAICHSVVVERHAGTIAFETEPNVGTTFIVRLPLGEVDAVREDAA